MVELPLIIFTLCMQAAIGAILWATVINTKAKNAQFKTMTLTALILSVVGMGASLLHLGRPLLAPTSLFNIASSWLSREILFSGAFFVLLLVYWWLERSDKNVTAVGYLTSIAGLVAIFAMGKLYTESIMPAWQNAYTFVSFYATAIVLGGVLMYLSAGKQRESLPRIDLVVLAVVLIQAAFAPGYVAALSSSSAGIESAMAIQGFTLLLSWLLTFGGAFLMILARQGKFAGQVSFSYLAVAILVVGVICSRYLFYAAGIPIGFGL